MVNKLPEKILVAAPEGIGDSILSFPGLQIFRQENPDAEITILVEAKMEPLWRMCPAVRMFQTLDKKFPNIGNLKRGHYDRVYLLRDDFRSAQMAWRVGIARRIGFRGRWRRLLLTEVVHRPDGHRQFEFMNILGVQGEPPAPEVAVPYLGFQTLERKLTNFPGIGKNLTVIFQALEPERPMGSPPILTLIPGGPNARWSVANFGLLAKNMVSSRNALVFLVGDAADEAVCAEVVDAAGSTQVVNLAGKTTIFEWAALLQMSDCVVSHDSGGMHLASAVGTPVVGLCGSTDSSKTSPLGKNIVLQKKEAVHDVEAIGVDEVYAAIEKLLKGRR